MQISLGMDKHGPVFDGRAAHAAHDLVQHLEEKLAQEGYNDVRRELGHVLKHPTGYYESRIQTDNLGGESVIHDGGVIYGPWLEGVGSRNRSTRFKGYFTFRKVAQRLNSRSELIARVIVPRYLRRMN